MMENQENNVENNQNNVVNVENNENKTEVKKEEIVFNTSDEHTSSNVSIEETAKNVQNKREKNKLLKVVLISIVGFLVLFIASFILFRYFSGLKEFTYSEEYPLYQYFAGEKNIYTGKVTLSLDDDISKIETKEGIEDMKDAPIYFQNIDNEVLTSNNMLLIFPRINNKNYRINAFSRVVYDKDSATAYYYLGKEKIFLDEVFLFDGSNLYLFLSNVSVVIDDETYELSPLSYIIVNYKEQIEIYDKATDKYTIIDTHEKDVIATLNTHKINLSVDMVNNNRLLLKSAENLPFYK